MGAKAATYKVALKTAFVTSTVTPTTTVNFNYIEYLRTAGPAFCTSFNAYDEPVETEREVGTVSDTFTTDTVVTVVTTPLTATVVQTSVITETAVATLVERRAVDDSGLGERYDVIFPWKNTASDTTATITRHIGRGSLAKRAAIKTPPSIRDFPSSRISSACSFVATGTSTTTIVGFCNVELWNVLNLLIDDKYGYGIHRYLYHHCNSQQ